MRMRKVIGERMVFASFVPSLPPSLPLPNQTHVVLLPLPPPLPPSLPPPSPHFLQREVRIGVGKNDAKSEGKEGEEEEQFSRWPLLVGGEGREGGSGGGRGGGGGAAVAAAAAPSSFFFSAYTEGGGGGEDESSGGENDA